MSNIHQGKKKPINSVSNKTKKHSIAPLILGLKPIVYEPIVAKYVELLERNTNYLGGQLSKSYLNDVNQVHEFLIGEVGLKADVNSKMLAITLQQLIHQEIRRQGIRDLRLNTAAKLQQGIHEIMAAIELFQMNALNVEGIKFYVRRKPFPKGHVNSNPKDFERTGNPKGLKTALGMEAVNLVMRSLVDRKLEFEEMQRLIKENEKLRKNYSAKESITRTRIASRMTKMLYSFLVTEMAMKSADSIHATAKILDAFGMMPILENTSSKKQKKKMYDLCRKYLKS